MAHNNQYQTYLCQPRQQHIVPMPSSDQDVNQRKFRKTRMCRYLPKCHKGDECPFAHTEEDLRAPPDLSKTRMCAGYLRNRCTMPASKCRFAHGEAELRTAPPVPPPQNIREVEGPTRDEIGGESSTYLESGPASETSSYQSGAVCALLSKNNSTRASRSRSSSISVFEDAFIGCDPACQATNRAFLKEMEQAIGKEINSWSLVAEALMMVSPHIYED
eukprot:CAMPEP_0206431732 /NCGR_PEP_ID=MMETSP0324_2-20121206/7525_1 /ASSEMBLY_ACC=CAM_ASM_000836 /TAXON_ID=2866 /ORGANISM="Crypthecodinium cohnii, Strain Seligo" /LENGTH=217 /DNA_ID=CAMNT_0053897687 /DNA_START=47 /DNA_END=701 /DNA_ORIENTATION=+